MDYRVNDRIIRYSQVVRYHGEIGPMPQTIGAHSWGVAWLVSEFHPAPSAKLLKACLEHDLPEYVTGDVSYVAKGDFPELRDVMDKITNVTEERMGMKSLLNLSPEDVWWLKWADLTEGALWCRYLSTSFGFQIYTPRWSAYTDALKKHLGNRPEGLGLTTDVIYFTQSIFLNPRDK